jgi:simple sugar transport system ATP-binding protein
MRGIVKHFPGVLANDHINLDLYQGEIHALLGENGAGKTTLMNILYGVYLPDEGEIFLYGHLGTIRSSRDAIKLKISMIHQNFMQIPTFTVTENICLGLRSKKEPFLDSKAAEAKIQGIAQSLGFTVQPRAKISELSIGDRQRVEIIKAVYRQAKVMILDEPTSVLTPQGTKELFHFLRGLVKKGISIVFITHKLEEIMAVADRVTVLRHGRKIATLPIAETNLREMAQLMMGGEELHELRKSETKPKGEVLRVKGLSVLSQKSILAVDNVSFTVCAGEIVGVAGVTGNGQSELSAALFGLIPVEKGKVIINGKDLTNASPSSILQEHVGFIPEDWEECLLGSETIWENAILDCHSSPSFSDRWGRIKFHNVYQHAEKLIQNYRVMTRSINSLAQELSGGNKQKLVLARELSRKPKLLIAANPTRGLDVGAEEYIQQQLQLGKEKGMAILLISTKLDEIMKLSDRIIVMFKARIMEIVSRKEATVEKIGLLMAGVKK